MPPTPLHKLTPEERKIRSIRARLHLRATVRLAFANAYWLVDLSGEVLGDDVAKNIRLLTQRTKKKSKFDLNQKRILNKPKHMRTEEEKTNLHRVLGGLKCFRRYPNHVKEKLSEVTYFKYVGPKRILVRQNDEAKNLCLVLAGDCGVYERTFDKLTKKSTTNELAPLKSGDVFGEVCMLHGVKRNATIITKDDCELLLVLKKDFDEVLRATVQAQWTDIKNCMSLFEYFDDWDEMTLRDGCILAKIKFYKTAELVLSREVGYPDYVYFVIEGQCDLVEYMDIEVSRKGCHRKFTLLPQEQVVKPSDKENRDSSVDEESLVTQIDFSTWKKKQMEFLIDKKVRKERRKHFFQIATYNPLSTFNIGEFFVRRYVIASRPSKILLIPRYWLVQRSKQIWNHIQQFLNMEIPRTNQIFEYFVDGKEWDKHKKSMVEEIQQRKRKANLNSIRNVPYSIRIEEDLYVYDCKEANKKRYP